MMSTPRLLRSIALSAFVVFAADGRAIPIVLDADSSVTSNLGGTTVTNSLASLPFANSQGLSDGTNTSAAEYSMVNDSSEAVFSLSTTEVIDGIDYFFASNAVTLNFTLGGMVDYLLGGDATFTAPAGVAPTLYTSITGLSSVGTGDPVFEDSYAEDLGPGVFTHSIFSAGTLGPGSYSLTYFTSLGTASDPAGASTLTLRLTPRGDIVVPDSFSTLAALLVAFALMLFGAARRVRLPGAA